MQEDIQNNNNSQIILEDEIDLKDYIRILKKRKWEIFVVSVICVALAVLFSFALTPIYEAKTTLLFDQNQGGTNILSDLAQLGKPSAIETQCELIQSRFLLKSVVEKLKLHQRKLPRFAFIRNTSSLFKMQNSSFIKSTIETLEKWFPEKNQNKEEENNLILDTVLNLERNLSVTPLKRTEIIEVQLQDPSQKGVSEILNCIAQTFVEQSLMIKRGEATAAREFIEKQLEKNQNELKDAEIELQSFKEKHKFFDLSEESKNQYEKYTVFESRHKQAETEIEIMQSQYDHISEELEKQEKFEETSSTITKNPIVENLTTKLYDLQLKYSNLKSEKFTESHPEVVNVKNQIKETTEKIKNEESKIFGSKTYALNTIYSELHSRKVEIRTKIESLKKEIVELDKVIKEFSKQFSTLPERELQLIRLTRNRKVLEELYILLTKKLEDSKIIEAMELGNIRIVDKAEIPKYPVKPKKKLNILIGAFIGFFFGIITAFTLEYFSNSFKSAEEVEQVLKLPVLATIPMISEAKSSINSSHSRKKRDEYLQHLTAEEEAQLISNNLITQYDPKSPVAEAYRSLRTNIQYMNLDSPSKAILVTSAIPSEGKSTTISNLAITLTQLGNKVLLVDCDLRRPVVHNIFNTEFTPGLTDMLINTSELNKCIKPTIIPNFFVLPAGRIPPNPSELISSKGMETLINKLRGLYDYIFFDCPPVLAVTDSVVLSTMIDGIILVINAEFTNKSGVKRAKTLLDNVKSKIFGVVLNGLNQDSGIGYYYYYQYYTDEDNKRKKKKNRPNK